MFVIYGRQAMTESKQIDGIKECYSCGEGLPINDCSKSKKGCGHHCNCSWVHDSCCWCKLEFGTGLKPEGREDESKTR